MYFREKQTSLYQTGYKMCHVINDGQFSCVEGARLLIALLMYIRYRSKQTRLRETGI